MITPCPRPYCRGALVSRSASPYGDGRKFVEQVCTLCNRSPEGTRPAPPLNHPHGPQPGFHKGVDVGRSHVPGMDRRAIVQQGSPAVEVGYQPGVQGWQTRKKAGQE